MTDGTSFTQFLVRLDATVTPHYPPHGNQQLRDAGVSVGTQKHLRPLDDGYIIHLHPSNNCPHVFGPSTHHVPASFSAMPAGWRRVGLQRWFDSTADHAGQFITSR